MNKTKIIIIGALMAAIAAIFQSLPLLATEAFVILTVLSALPIYMAARLNPFAGTLSFIVAAILIFLVSTHEALFFICTNGIVGLSLGICRCYKMRIPVILPLCSAILTIFLSIMNYGIGIPIFGTKIPGTIIIQIVTLFIFSLAYNFIYLVFADFIFKRLKIAGI
jgi:hypothetical protein